jgi:hypothetical protein
LHGSALENAVSFGGLDSGAIWLGTIIAGLQAGLSVPGGPFTGLRDDPCGPGARGFPQEATFIEL